MRHVTGYRRFAKHGKCSACSRDHFLGLLWTLRIPAKHAYVMFHRLRWIERNPLVEQSISSPRIFPRLHFLFLFFHFLLLSGDIERQPLTFPHVCTDVWGRVSKVREPAGST